MTQYLVTTFKDSTGRKHTHITKAKSNQRFTVVEAESKEEAKEKYESQNTPIVYYTNNSKVTLFERPSEEVLGSFVRKEIKSLKREIIMFNTPKMKLPEKHEVFKTYKNGTPEEKLRLKAVLLKLLKMKIVNFTAYVSQSK